MPEMTAKPKRSTQARGLPATFGLDAPLGARKPVQLGDYLDEPAAPSRPEPVATPKPEPVVEAPAPTAETPKLEPVVEKPAAPKPAKKRGGGSGGGGAVSTTLPASARSKFTRNGPPRKQINMRPETLDRARELLWLVQEYGPQPDAKASEMFEALVDLLWDARGQLDLSDVPLRGKWGDASAREFPQHLKRAFATAITRSKADKAPPAVRLSKLAA